VELQASLRNVKIRLGRNQDERAWNDLEEVQRLIGLKGIASEILEFLIQLSAKLRSGRRY
jgi:hypothetical protein